MFDHLILKTPYLLLDRPNVLVIGVGGGTDIVNAIKQRCVARHRRRARSGHGRAGPHRPRRTSPATSIDRPDVTMIAGRAAAPSATPDENYDLIQMTGVDTLAALSTGAYVLAENYLYTTDAMREFLDHLTPNGLLSVAVADYSQAAGFPRHTMRQLSLFLDGARTARHRGPRTAHRRDRVDRGVPQVSMLMRQTPFTAEEVERLQRFADGDGLRALGAPGRSASTPCTPATCARRRQDREHLLADYPLILTPTTDDNPFFFNFYRWRNLLDNLDEVDVGHTLATGQIILGLILLFSVRALGRSHPGAAGRVPAQGPAARRAAGASSRSSSGSASASSSSRSASSRSSSCSSAIRPTRSRSCCSRCSRRPASAASSPAA